MTTTYPAALLYDARHTNDGDTFWARVRIPVTVPVAGRRTTPLAPAALGLVVADAAIDPLVISGLRHSRLIATTQTVVWRVRLARCDTPERTEPGYAEATAYTLAWLKRTELTPRTPYPLTLSPVGADPTDDWNRVVCEVTNPAGENLSDLLMRDGHATPYRRGVPVPVEKAVPV